MAPILLLTVPAPAKELKRFAKARGMAIFSLSQQKRCPADLKRLAGHFFSRVFLYLTHSDLRFTIYVVRYSCKLNAGRTSEDTIAYLR